MKELTKQAKRILIGILISILIVGSGIGAFFIFRDNNMFYIYNLGIDIGPYETGEFRADNFNPNNSHFDNFIGFGQYLQPGKMNSCFEWRLDISAHVYAPCDAKIVRIEYQGASSDWSILLAPKNDKGKYSSRWRIDMDHVIIDSSLNLKRGSVITEGQILGTVGTWSGGIGRFEIDIVKSEIHYAPMLFVHESIKAKASAKIQSLVNLFGSYHATDPGAEMFAVGCWRSPFGDGTYIPESYYAGM